jgi:Zn-dependent alcohol dehydrogenase
MRAKAAICYTFGQPLEMEEISIQPPQRGEVLVRLAATGICHSDVHTLHGDLGGRVPLVAGHEGAGIVEALGPEVATVRPGDHVVVSLLRSCGQCFACQHDTPHVCTGSFALQTESRLRNARGEVLYQGINTAAFAEYVVVDQSQLVRIPADFPLDRAALLACGVITGFGAVVNTARVPAGSSVAVVGCGGVGVNAVQGAAVAGAHPIIALDMLESKAKLARAFGATHVVTETGKAASAAVKELTGGQGVDFAFVTVGSIAAIEQAIRLIRRLGTVVVVGLPHRSATLNLSVVPLVLNGQRIVGSFMGSARLQTDVPHLAELYQQGRLKLDELITARYPLEQINTAIAAMELGTALRNVITFDI